MLSRRCAESESCIRQNSWCTCHKAWPKISGYSNHDPPPSSNSSIGRTSSIIIICDGPACPPWWWDWWWLFAPDHFLFTTFESYLFALLFADEDSECLVGKEFVQVLPSLLMVALSFPVSVSLLWNMHIVSMRSLLKGAGLYPVVSLLFLVHISPEG